MVELTVVSWYPITPSTSLVSSFEDFAREFRWTAITGKHNFQLYQAGKMNWPQLVWLLVPIGMERGHLQRQVDLGVSFDE